MDKWQQEKERRKSGSKKKKEEKQKEDNLGNSSYGFQYVPLILPLPYIPLSISRKGGIRG